MRSPSASVAAAGHVLPYEGSELWQEVYQSYYVFTVSRWERGRALPDPKAAAKLARLAEIVEIIGEAIRPEDVATFLMTPHPELRGHAPGGPFCHLLLVSLTPMITGSNRGGRSAHACATVGPPPVIPPDSALHLCRNHGGDERLR